MREGMLLGIWRLLDQGLLLGIQCCSDAVSGHDAGYLELLDQGTLLGRGMLQGIFRLYLSHLSIVSIYRLLSIVSIYRLLEDIAGRWGIADSRGEAHVSVLNPKP